MTRLVTQESSQLASDLKTLLELQKQMRSQGYDEVDIARTIVLIARGGECTGRQPVKVSETVNTQEAAEILNVHTSSVEKLISQGRLAAGKVGRRWVMLRRDVQEFAERTISQQTEQRVIALGSIAGRQPVPPSKRRKSRVTRKCQ